MGQQSAVQLLAGCLNIVLKGSELMRSMLLDVSSCRLSTFQIYMHILIVVTVQ